MQKWRKLLTPKKKTAAPKKIDTRKTVDTARVFDEKDPAQLREVADSLLRLVRSICVNVLDWPMDMFLTADMERPIDLNKMYEQLRALKTRADNIEYAFNLLTKGQYNGKKESGAEGTLNAPPAGTT